MNKLILKMPKFAILKYIKEHFSELTEEDYFELVKMRIPIPYYLLKFNNELKQSKEVLMDVINNSPIDMIHFNGELFDDNLLEDIASKDIYINESFVLANLQFLKNKIFRIKAVLLNPSLIRVIDNENITEGVISALEDNDYILTEEDLKYRPVLLKSEKLLNNTLNDDYKSIVNFPEEALTYEVCEKAIKRGFIASEEDLLKNPVLCDRAPIMKVAIKRDAKLIRYVTAFCGMQLDVNTINAALQKYKITEDDLAKNPELCRTFYVMVNYPEYHLYSKFATKEEKIAAIKEALVNKDYEKLKTFPFFNSKFNSNVNSEDIVKLAQLLTINILDISEVDNRKYHIMLDYIIDGIVNLKYQQAKENFEFSDIAALDFYVMSVFLHVNKSNNLEELNILSTKLFNFVNMNRTNKIYMSLDYLNSRIRDLYSQYSKNAWLSRNITTVFYNEILNKQRNCYFSNEKLSIINDVKKKLELTKKKKNTIYVGRKLEIITKSFINNDYTSLGLTKEELEMTLSDVEIELKNNKNLMKLGIIIDEFVLNDLKFLFLKNGRLEYEEIANILNTNNIEAIQYVFRKFEQSKLKYITKIKLSDKQLLIDESVKSNIGFHYNYFDAVTNDKYIENVAHLLFNINEKDAKKIISNSVLMHEIIDVLAFANLLPELNIETITSVLSNYDLIKNKMNMSLDECLDDINYSIFARFSDLISLANGYNAVNDFYTMILGKRVVDKIGIKDIEKYFEFYKKMYMRTESEIPAIHYEKNNLIFESGNYDLPERLLIGRNCNYVCVDLTNIAGRQTFTECLAEKSGDVILIHDKQNPDFFARILLFRRGNVVQLSSAFDNNGKAIKLDEETAINIAQQILQQSLEADDNLDFVFINGSSIDSMTSLPEIVDERFVQKFPHGDFEDSAYLIGNKKNIELSKVLQTIDFDSKISVSYQKQRKPITKNASDEELTRIKALKYILGYTQGLTEEFEPFYRKAYKDVISGEDWYIAIKENGEFETVIIPVDARTNVEFEGVSQLIGFNNEKRTI